MRSSSRSARSCDGQASVELVLSLPVVVVCLLAVVQVAVVAAGRLALADAARDAARRAAVEDDRRRAEAAAAAAAGVSGSADRQVDVTWHDGDPPLVAVTVRARIRTDVPLVGGFVPDVWLRSEVVMVREGG